MYQELIWIMLNVFNISRPFSCHVIQHNFHVLPFQGNFPAMSINVIDMSFNAIFMFCHFKGIFMSCQSRFLSCHIKAVFMFCHFKFVFMFCHSTQFSCFVILRPFLCFVILRPFSCFVIQRNFHVLSLKNVKMTFLAFSEWPVLWKRCCCFDATPCTGLAWRLGSAWGKNN